MVLNEWDIINMEQNGYMLKYELCPYWMNSLVPFSDEELPEELNRMLWNSTIQFYVDIAVLLDGDWE